MRTNQRLVRGEMSEDLLVVVVSADVILQISFGHETFLTVGPSAHKLLLLKVNGHVHSQVLSLVEYFAAARELTLVDLLRAANGSHHSSHCMFKLLVGHQATPPLEGHTAICKLTCELG